jgi:glycyl-tRNA synthetase beta chain
MVGVDGDVSMNSRRSQSAGREHSGSVRAGGGELLLELFSEEIPARMQASGLGWLEGFVRQRLQAAQIPASDIKSFVTPRRMVILAGGIPGSQPDRIEERRGPRVGSPESAVAGFLRSCGLSSAGELTEGELPNGRFYFAEIRHLGRTTAEVLPDLVRNAITRIPWPKSMRFPTAGFRWVRPLRSVICLFDGNVVPILLDEIPIGRSTRGHRFLSPGEICVENAADYLDKLQRAHVSLDQERRREAIRADLDRRAAELGVSLKPDAALLDEVTGLAEFPVVLAGAIDPDFTSLPPEVLATAMRVHQKYFSCANLDGSAAPHFLFVADNRADDGGKAIVAGNERVLRARLADARFFWDQDRKIRLADRVEALKDRIYHDKLGTMYDKAGRMEKIILSLHPAADASQERAKRAARLAKADLSTAMVGEFPELQGIMGGYYARHDGEDPGVAQAIAEHYRPLGPSDACPEAPEGVFVALADKIDALVSFFAIGEKPTGSRDPFALRRAALGVVRLILENGLRLRLREGVFRQAWVAHPPRAGIDDRGADLLEFIIDRLKVHLREQGVRHDLIAAAFAQAGGSEDDLVRLVARVQALRLFVDSEDGANLLVAYRRAANIVAIEEKKDGRRHDGAADRALLQLSEERRLAGRLDEVSAKTDPLLRGEQFEPAMAELARLRGPVDEFFENVTVNVNEPELRANRLRLLSSIRTTMNRVADFSQIEG